MYLPQKIPNSYKKQKHQTFSRTEVEANCLKLIKGIYEKSTLIILNGKALEGFPGGSDGKGSTCNVGDLGSMRGLGRSPGEGNGNPLQYSCLENPDGQRCLVGYGPWSCRVRCD